MVVRFDCCKAWRICLPSAGGRDRVEMKGGTRYSLKLGWVLCSTVHIELEGLERGPRKDGRGIIATV
jgi:hypothetical protein